MSKREVIETLLRRGRVDLANVTAYSIDLASVPAATDDPALVTAASIARIFQHFDQAALDTGILIVSADRGDRAMQPDGTVDGRENEKLNKVMRQKLKALIKPLGGYIETKGGYKETGGGIVYEHSFVIPNVSLDRARALARQLGKGAELNGASPAAKLRHEASLHGDFRQDSVLWGNARQGVFLFEHDGGAIALGKRFNANNVQNFFTEWRGRRIGFSGDVAACVSIEYCPTGPSDWRQWRSLVSRVHRDAAARTAAGRP